LRHYHVANPRRPDNQNLHVNYAATTMKAVILPV
jgi:hypothetical protein